MPSLAKHKQGHYDPDWEREYPWVYPSDDGKGMFCNCVSASTPAMFESNSCAIFNVIPCISLRTDVLARQADSCMHKLAISWEHECLASEQGGGIEQAFCEAVSLERKATVGAMKCLYWLAKNEIAHTAKYVPLLELARGLGCIHVCFDNLHAGGEMPHTQVNALRLFST